MQKITPMLWFDKEAEQAAHHYVSVFSKRPGQKRGESKILEVSRYGEAGPGQMGSAMVVRLQLEGQEFEALNGGPEFKFSEAISFVIDCENQEEVDYFWKALIEGGGREDQCGWLKDRFGLSWQVTPRQLIEMLGDRDQEKAQRAMKAMLQMKKIDIAELQRAFEGAPARV
jgi:predicted 3-demethylubiquinone-9 3-methyltransferase (glyoxalase superfamily)